MIQKKVCLLGASGVGKTSLVRQYVEGIFSEKYLTSIGVKIDKKQVTVDDDQVQLLLWDIEGVDCYSGFNARYLRGATAAIIVVDQTRPQSLHEGVEICRLVKSAADIPVLLTINKQDLAPAEGWHDLVESERGEWFHAPFGTSAKTGDGVEPMFLSIANLALQQ